MAERELFFRDGTHKFKKKENYKNSIRIKNNHYLEIVTALLLLLLLPQTA